MRAMPALVLLVSTLTCGSPELPATDPGRSCVVRRLSDGDSFYCEGGQRVRLTGIDAPEMDQGEAGRLSRDALARLIPAGTPIRLELDVAATDRYRRVLAYAWRDSLMVNREMVRRGWAVVYTVPPNIRHAESLKAAQDTARAEQAGHWQSSGFSCLPRRHRLGEC